jgi:hypothetical protein
MDTLIAWEQAVLAGELPGRPDEPESTGDTSTAPAVTEPEPEPTPPSGGALRTGDADLVPAPTRRRTRGTQRAA